eukprot:1718045-Prymnesium_polylepis.1
MSGDPRTEPPPWLLKQWVARGGESSAGTDDAPTFDALLTGRVPQKERRIDANPVLPKHAVGSLRIHLTAEDSDSEPALPAVSVTHFRGPRRARSIPM